MLLKDFVKSENKIFHWSVCNNKNEQIAMTNKQTLLKLCQVNKEFKISVDAIVERNEAASFIKVRLKTKED